MKHKIITFGEIMGRLATPGHLRFRQAVPGNLEVTFAGAEASVAVSLKVMGRESEFVTAIPRHGIAEACMDSVRRFGVETDHILISSKGRLGMYFLETGANQRPSQVIYDRDYSSLSMTPAEEYDWEDIFREAQWLHLSGITPALSETSAQAAVYAAREAARRGITVSCDLNYRNKLWKWHPEMSGPDLAGNIMRQILPFVTVVIANEEDAANVLDIHASNTDVESGRIDSSQYRLVAEEICRQFPDVKYVGITLRESMTADHNNWGAMLYDAENKESFLSPLDEGEYRPYQIRNIVDRLGGGDSFAAGLIFGLTDEVFARNNQLILDFAVAASCLGHSIKGDFNYSTREEIMALVKGNSTGRVNR